MKKQTKKLTLNKKTISNLTAAEMSKHVGGSATGHCSNLHTCGGLCGGSYNCGGTRNGNTCAGHNTCTC